MPVSYPLINGVRYDFSSIEFRAASRRVIGLKSINYASALEPGEVRGTVAQPIGRTRGQYKPEGSFEIYREDWDDLMLALISIPGATSSPQPASVPGFMEVSFDIAVQYSEIGLGAGGVQTDLLQGCRIKKADNSNAQGTDALTVKCDLSVMLIVHNGRLPINVALR